MSTRRIGFGLLVSALAVSATNVARGETLHTRLHYAHRDAVRHHEYVSRESLPGVDLYPSVPTVTYPRGVLREPGTDDRYFNDTREGQPHYQQGSTFVTRGFDLLPDSRPPN